MKIPLSMLKSFLPIDLPIAEIEKTLSMLGIEVDAVYAPVPAFSGVVVAEVKSTRRHPEAEKLQIAEVFDGKETAQIVCAASNCRAGMKTAFAKVGARIPKVQEIKAATIRGVPSAGMLVSASELELYEDENGILDLPPDFPLGADCVPLLWDPVLEISLTPNLGHCMSALGIARELSAAWNIPLQLKKSPLHEAPSPLLAKASVENGKHCPRYMLRQIENVQVRPSPFWLQRELLAAGFRPINNIVDATNYILLKYGQPMHAFDLDRLEGKTLRVTLSEKETPFETLTGTTVEVPSGTLLICDALKPVAIAGVMGGANSAVTAQTKQVALEAASFDPLLVRIASKKTGLRTDSSLRFEKSVDPSSIPMILDEAAKLIAELSGGHIAHGAIDCKAQEFLPKQILCRPERVNSILGTKLSVSEIESIFHRLGFKVSKETVEVPLYRADISAEIDLIEEVARIYGYNNIERPLPKATTPQIAHNPEYLFETELRRRLIGLGLQEFLTCDLISPKLASLVEEVAGPKKLLRTLHSKSEEYSVLRSSLLPGLLEVVRRNLDLKNASFAAFEIGRVHFQEGDTPIEFPMTAILLTGKHRPHHWDKKPEEADFFDGKGLAQNLLSGLRIHSVEFSASKHPTFHPGRQAEIRIGNQVIGTLGELHPHLLAKLDIKQRVVYAELNASLLQSNQSPPPKCAPLAQFPASERDWTLTLDPKTSLAPLFHKIQEHAPILLEKFEVIDLFRADEKSNVTLRFTYRDRSKTLSFEEVEAAHARLLQSLN